MNKSIIFIALFSFYTMAQVAPYKIPYNVITNKSTKLDFINQASFNFENSDFRFDLNQNKYIWEKTFIFNSDERVIVKFNSQDCLEELFLIGDKDKFSGPYDIQSISQTNPLKSQELTVQISSSSYCNLDTFNFIIEKHINDIIKSEVPNVYDRNREDPIILITGYWPPTNEMIRPFSQDIDLNSDGWIGDNWEGRGYDIISFFPEFDSSDCSSCGQGYGDLEVDYQDTSEDFWPITNELNPIAIITFSRGYIDYSWELEYNYYNRLNWIGDFSPPYLPTPNPPDSDVENYFIRHSSLPMYDIMERIEDENLGLDSYIDWEGDPGHYVSEFMGYHGAWYHDINQLGENKCITAGHIHVGGLVDIETAKSATEATIRSVIDLLDQSVYTLGDINQDEIIDILDLVMIVNYILGTQDFETIQTYAADINEDGIINIQDVITIINIILEN